MSGVSSSFTYIFEENPMKFDFKKAIFLVITLLCTLPNYASDYKIPKSSVFIPHTAGKAHLVHGKNGFAIKKQGQLYPVKSHDIAKPLHGITQAQLAAFICSNGKLTVRTIGDDYGVSIAGNLKGGGPIGATVGAVAGKAAVCGLGYGFIATVSNLAGPAAGWVAPALTGLLAPTIEAASNVAAIGCGIALGTATGPF